MELDPKNKNAQGYRAYAFLSKQEWNKAVEDYSKVIEKVRRMILARISAEPTRTEPWQK